MDARPPPAKRRKQYAGVYQSDWGRVFNGVIVPSKLGDYHAWCMPGSRDIKEDAPRIYDVREHIKSKSHTRHVETRQKERKTSDVHAPTAAAGIISPSAIKQRAHRLKRSLPESPTKLALSCTWSTTQRKGRRSACRLLVSPIGIAQ